jgi:hypothetical protein
MRPILFRLAGQLERAPATRWPPALLFAARAPRAAAEQRDERAAVHSMTSSAREGLALPRPRRSVCATTASNEDRG